MTLGELIKEYREQHAMNMEDFANRAGLSKAYISILERNINPVNSKAPTPSLETIKAVSAAVGLDFNQVIDALDGNQEISLSPIEENLDAAGDSPNNMQSIGDPLPPREQDLLKFYRGVGPSAQDYLYNKAKLLYTDAIIERDAPTIGGIAAYGGDSDAIIQTKDQQKKAEEFWRKQNEKNRKD